MSCAKASYPSRNAALLTLALLRSRPNRKERAAYRCRECPNWHLTTKRPVKWGIRGSRVDFA